MRAGTIHVFLLFVYCSYHAPYLEVPDQQRCAGLSVWPAQRDTSGRIMHVCPLVSVCFSLCFIHLCVCVPVQRANLIIQHAVRASEGGGRGRISSPKVSLSTAIKFLFFFRGISSCIPVIDFAIKTRCALLIKDLVHTQDHIKGLLNF